MDMQLKSLKAQSHGLAPSVTVGKAGITEEILNEIKTQLKKKKLMKIKLLKSAADERGKNAARDLALRVNATLVRQVGGTIVLYRERL